MAIIGGGIIPGIFGSGGGLRLAAGDQLITTDGAAIVTLDYLLNASGALMTTGGASVMTNDRLLKSTQALLTTSGSARMIVDNLVAATGALLIVSGAAVLTVAAASGVGTTILATQAASLEGYWPCDETTGTTLADATAAGLDMTASGGFTLAQTGQDGNAVLFDGTNGLASAQVSTAAFSGSPAGDFTYMALMKIGTLSTNVRYLGLGQDNATANINNIALQAGLSTSSQFRLNHRDNEGDLASGNIGTGSLVAGTWKLYTIRWDASTQKFTKSANTTHFLSAAFASFDNIIPDMFQIGGINVASSGPAYGNSTIQHAAIWSFFLSDAEIAAIVTAAGL